MGTAGPGRKPCAGGAGQHHSQVAPAQQRRHPRACPCRRSSSSRLRARVGESYRKLQKRAPTLPRVELGLPLGSAIPRRLRSPVHQLPSGICPAPGKRGETFPSFSPQPPRSLIQHTCSRMGKASGDTKMSCLSGMYSLNDGSVHPIRFPL